MEMTHSIEHGAAFPVPRDMKLRAAGRHRYVIASRGSHLLIDSPVHWPSVPAGIVLIAFARLCVLLRWWERLVAFENGPRSGRR